jgi:predicted nucleic-acid-binding protein
MIGLDTKILVRYLTRDDEHQWQQAATIIQQTQPCFVTNIVLCELVWVLRGATYGFHKDEIIHVLEAMLHSAAFEFENRAMADQALGRYKQGKANFSDYLIGAVARQSGCTETVSFDGKLTLCSRGRKKANDAEFEFVYRRCTSPISIWVGLVKFIRVVGETLNLYCFTHKLHPIPGGEFFTSPGFNVAVDFDLAGCDQLFGLSSGSYPSR